jgi:tripartite-type tricarboxylate transporter receptor subunit TctC
VFSRRDILTFGSAWAASETLAPALHPALARPKYPERPIRLVIPYTSGSAADIVGRIWADEMNARLGPVFVENQGGGGGLVGATAVAHANPDGYSILLGNFGTHIRTGTAQPYNPVSDFAPISILVLTTLCIVSNPSLPVRTVKELIDYAKSNPGKLSYGSSGVGSASHFASEMFKSITGATGIIEVPYKGVGHALSDVISGHISMTAMSLNGQLLDLHRTGQVRMLAVTGPVRLAVAPDIPTAIEAGVPGMIARNFMGLFAPAGTPTAIIEQISQATHSAIASDECQQKLIAGGFEPYPDSSPEAARRFVEDEINRWRPVIKAIGL